MSATKRRKESSIAQAGGAPVAGPTAAAEPVPQQIKLALNVHGGDRMVVRGGNAAIAGGRINWHDLGDDIPEVVLLGNC